MSYFSKYDHIFSFDVSNNLKQIDMSGTIQFISTSPQELQNQINEGVKIQLAEFLKHFKPIQHKEYYTRQEVANIFSVDLSTIHNWCKSKRLNPLGIGSRVYFLKSDVEASLKPLNV